MIRAWHGLMLAAALFGVGCKAALVPCEPRTVQLTLSASEKLNPDDLGRPLPTTVVLYQLKDATRLENANFSDLWRDPKAVLQDDFVQSEELILSPSETVGRTLVQKPGATHVAAVALVRHPAGTTWRLARRVVEPGQICTENKPRLDPLDLSLRLDGYELRKTESSASAR